MINIDKFNKDLENKYIAYDNLMSIKNQYHELFKTYKGKKLKYLFNRKVKNFIKNYQELDKVVIAKNKVFVEKEMARCAELFSNVSGYALDRQQKEAVITDDDILIVAGAGSGKTLTMIGKIMYLIKEKKVKPSEILCISFTNFTTASLIEAIKKNIDCDIDVYTFHKLGYEIIRQNRKNLLICDEHKLDVIIETFFTEDVFASKDILDSVVNYLAYYVNVANIIENSEKNEAHIETLKSELRENKQTLKGEFVSNSEDLYIANYLYMHGIDYIYKHEYPLKKNYYPTFYLVDADIYLEHFSIIKDHNASLNYLEMVEEVKKIHSLKETNLIITYSFYFSEGTIDNYLESLISENSIMVKQLDKVDVYNKIVIKEKIKNFKNLQNLIKTFIALYKANNYDGDKFLEIEKKIKKEKNKLVKQKNQLLLQMIYRIFLLYQNSLLINNELDFNDMINYAATLVKQNGCFKKYRYIIIDEYQDTSYTRYNLIKSIKDACCSKLVAVGDDFQSIYRFTGCNLDMFVSFKDYFPSAKLLKIENTYRNSQELIDIASKFIMKNKKQIKKKLKSSKHLDKPIKLFYYDDLSDFELLLDRIGSKVIYILGRNNRDINFLVNNSHFILHDNEIVYKKRADLKIVFMTVHSSKGLECDDVIIINLTNNMTGFPNKIVDDDILGYVNNVDVKYPYDEERRLFYVALTRTKNNVYLFASKRNTSIFVNELVSDNKNIEVLNDFYICPNCGKKLVYRNGKYGKFLGCKGYPKCTYTQKIC